MLRTARLQRERLRWRVGLSRQELAPGRGRTARRDHKTRTDPVVPVLGAILLTKLVLLSSDGKQVIVHSGHNMNLEAPGRGQRCDSYSSGRGAFAPPFENELRRDFRQKQVRKSEDVWSQAKNGNTSFQSPS